MAIGAAQVGMSGTAESNSTSRQLAAIGRASEWLNSPRLTPESLAGKVVLAQFWTYTCINWLRTLPYVRAWTQKYRQKLVVIGVHTPEFAFEHNIDNVRRAVRQMGIEYPVAIDNDYSLWRAFNNQYWPALYFVDARGRIREHHFGEGDTGGLSPPFNGCSPKRVSPAFVRVTPCRLMPKASKPQRIGTT